MATIWLSDARKFNTNLFFNFFCKYFLFSSLTTNLKLTKFLISFNFNFSELVFAVVRSFSFFDFLEVDDGKQCHDEEEKTPEAKNDVDKCQIVENSRQSGKSFIHSFYKTWRLLRWINKVVGHDKRGKQKSEKKVERTWDSLMAIYAYSTWDLLQFLPSNELFLFKFLLLMALLDHLKPVFCLKKLPRAERTKFFSPKWV